MASSDSIEPIVASHAGRRSGPGGRLHLVDVGGDMTARDGLAARRMLRSRRVAGNLGDSIPRLLHTAGFDCTEVASHRQRFAGRLTYYRATRPA